LHANHSKTLQTGLNSLQMSLRQFSRPALALVAAYAVALQAMLLVVAAPVTGGGDSYAQPICAHAGAHGSGSAPVGQCCDCMAICVAGCSSAATPPSEPTGRYALEWVRTDAPVVAVVPRLHLSAIGVHRSRAPPLG
jgi:hypothetical protein